jgi:2-aminoethylphosphonate-pyruvate transaminase
MEHKEQLLLTPGPLTTAETTREAMRRDWASRDPAFIELTQRIRARIAALAGAGDTHNCIPLQGSGTYGLEAAIATFVPRDGRVLVLANGGYCHRIVKICEILGRTVQFYETGEDTPPDPAEVRRRLTLDKTISHVVMVHCETTSGILNPLAEVAAIVAESGRSLIVDAMSSFGAIPIDMNATPIDVLISSSNKCLEGVPGIAFILAKNETLATSTGNAGSLVLDLQAQASGFDKTGEWRFTPPTHVVAALDAALDQLDEEGGVAARNARYTENCSILVDGMVAIGFHTYLSHNLQAPIIVTFLTPKEAAFDFEAFYEGLQNRGFTIYPGKLTRVDSFRIGCIGQVFPGQIRAALAAVGEVVGVMGISL